MDTRPEQVEVTELEPFWDKNTDLGAGSQHVRDRDFSLRRESATTAMPERIGGER